MQNNISYKYYFLFLISIFLANDMLSLEQIYLKLNIDKKIILDTIIVESENLVSIGENILGKEIFLTKKCAKAWNEMYNAAINDSIRLSIVSGFRSYNKQYSIIKNKLNKGMTINNILKENKLPGLSQHHSGNAIDIISSSHKLSVNFAKSAAYIWLEKNANQYGFYLQYPKNTKDNMIFEPWHWYYKEK